MDFALIALTFGTIFLVELPDKTFLATLVLSTKYRPLYVWVGVGLAFGVQTLVAVGLGSVATLLPTSVVRGVSLAMFLAGFVLLLREARSHGSAQDEAEEEGEFAAKAEKYSHGAQSAGKVIGASFLVLFAAEWGDLSQLLTLTLVAKHGHPVSIFLGAWVALLTVSGLAVIVGRALLQWIPLQVLHYIGAAVCLLLAGLTAWELFS